MTGALGLVFAALFARSVTEISPYTLWALYFSLTSIHIFANMKCMKLIAFDYFNRSRMDLVVNKFFSDLEAGGRQDNISVNTPLQVSKDEKLLFFHPSPAQKVPIRMGVSFNKFIEITGDDSQLFLEKQLKKLQSDGYTLSLGKNRHGSFCIVAVFGNNCKPETRAKSYFHALLLQRTILNTVKGLPLTNENDVKHIFQEEMSKRLQQEWRQFSSKTKSSGWDLSRTELHTEGFEVSII